MLIQWWTHFSTTTVFFIFWLLFLFPLLLCTPYLQIHCHKRSMENGTTTGMRRWNFKENEKLVSVSDLTVRSVLNKLRCCVDPADTRPTIPLGHGDPSAFPCFRTTTIAEDAISDAVRSAKFNGYSSTVGILPARRYTFFNRTILI